MKRLSAAFFLLLLLAIPAQAYQITVYSSVPVYQSGGEVHFLDNLTPEDTPGVEYSETELKFIGSIVLTADAGETGGAYVDWSVFLEMHAFASGAWAQTATTYTFYIADGSTYMLYRTGSGPANQLSSGEDSLGQPVADVDSLLSYSESGSVYLEFGVEYSVVFSLYGWGQAGTVWWSQGEGDPLPFDPVTSASIRGYSFNLEGTAVPEPSTFVLAALGLGGLALLRRRFF